LAVESHVFVIHEKDNPYRSPESTCSKADVERQCLRSAGWYNMRRVVTLIIIFFATLVLAVVLTPTPDPFSCGIFHAAFLGVAIPCYFVGLHQGRTLVGTRANTGANNAAASPPNPAAGGGVD
jgi:hypothetical protein